MQFIDFLKQKFVDLVFMDVDMSVLDGIEATRQGVSIFRDLKVIGISYHDEDNYIKEMIKAGARSYLVKDKLTKNAIKNIVGIG